MQNLTTLFQIKKQNFFLAIPLLVLCVLVFIFSNFITDKDTSETTIYNEYVFVDSISWEHIVLSVADGNNIKIIPTKILTKAGSIYRPEPDHLRPVPNTAYMLKQYSDASLHLCLMRDCVQISPHNDLLALF